jgi:predicted small lipoprotein YifL
MQKTLTYAMLLAATLGLAACGEKSDHKVEPANTAAPQASQSTGDAAAVEQKAAEATENTTAAPQEAAAATEQKAAEATEGAAEEKK